MRPIKLRTGLDLLLPFLLEDGDFAAAAALCGRSRLAPALAHRAAGCSLSPRLAISAAAY